MTGRHVLRSSALAVAATFAAGALLAAPSAQAQLANGISALSATPAALTYGAPTTVRFDVRAAGQPVHGGTATLRYPGHAVTVRLSATGHGVTAIPGLALAAGHQTLTVAYGVVSAALPVTVNATAPTVRASVDSTSAPYGSREKARVLVTGPVDRPARGYATFYYDTTAITRVALDPAGRAVIWLPTLRTPGPHTVWVRYSPAVGANLVAAIGHAPLAVGHAPVAWTIVLPKLPPAYGHVGTIVAQLASPAGVPSGNVVLRNGSTVLASAAVDPTGRATLTFPISFTPGNNVLSASYSGNAKVSSGSQVIRLVTFRAAPAISITTPSAVVFGTRGGATVTVNGAPAVAGGVVTVTIDGASVASSRLIGGSATFSLPILSAGVHTIGASYSGDARYAAGFAPGRLVTTATSQCPVSANACVDLTHNLTWLQSNGVVTYGPVPMLSGRPGFRSEDGTFSVYFKDRIHFSSIFNDAPMPNSVFFDNGIAFHEGSLSIESHGCIHLSHDASEYYFDHLSYGDEVVVWGYAPY